VASRALLNFKNESLFTHVLSETFAIPFSRRRKHTVGDRFAMRLAYCARCALEGVDPAENGIYGAQQAE
jgi:hypothetical protein